MTQQGDTNWWDKLYDASAEDTTPAPTPDSLDERYDSAAATTTDLPAPPPEAPPAVPSPASGPPPAPDTDADAATILDAVPPPPGAVPPTPPPPPETPAPPAEAPAPPAEAPPAPAPEPGPDTVPDAAPPAPTAQVPAPRPRTEHVGSRPPTYEAEPTALPAARPDELDALVADTVLDGARYGAYTLRAASVRGDSARFRGEPRRDALLTARFGQDEAALVLVAVAAGRRDSEHTHLAAADVCRWIAESVGRSHSRLSEDIRAARRGDLKSGLHRLTDRTYGKLRARAAERGLDPEEYTAGLRCLLLTADPDCRTRVFFGIGAGGLFRLRDGAWQDIEPLLPDPATTVGGPVVGFGSPPRQRPATAPDPAEVPGTGDDGDRLTMRLGVAEPPNRPYVEDPPPPPAEPFRFRASVARPGDTLLLASHGLAEPMRGEPSLARELAARWAGAEPPGLAAFLADTQLRVTGYADDRTGVAVWEA
ncbi:protein phosphatase 2C domain-containing protein [Streptomyces roseicoloratus]|uniref:Protein phosphatase 2C domain-containing protein n=2 Tax=Streptomyces roseicoloratus TaxID=2508722 RepID=A0ABY9RQA5_9ACTN|nr:protein phosphatase 2C domain-containing protein [Streptomyces roseicoloratus]WMX44388.1 protein phosphatase 2C domain-containing protein [Streptomyces roseicoloratus]